MRRLVIAALLFCLLAAGACGGGAKAPTLTKGVTITSTRTVSPSVTFGGPVPTTAPPGGQDWSTITPPDRLIVRNGSVTMLVDDIPAALTQISQLAGSAGGWVVSSQSWRSGERNLGSISFRVPVASFEGVMASLAGLAVEVTSQSTSSEDVTAEYVDLAARLKNLEATERQLLAIMERATDIADVLAVQRELTTVREDIEQAKGRLQYLENTAAMSLVTVSLEQSSLGVDITAGRAVVNQGEEVEFAADIFGGFAPFSYEWDFGDGVKSTLASPEHAYARPGTYTVSLRVTDDRGNSYTETRTDYITVRASGWSIGRVFEGAWQALITFGRGLLSVGAVLLVFSPLWLIPLVVVWLVRRRRKAGVRK